MDGPERSASRSPAACSGSCWPPPAWPRPPALASTSAATPARAGRLRSPRGRHEGPGVRGRLGVADPRQAGDGVAAAGRRQPRGLRQMAWDRGMEEVKAGRARVIDGEVRFGFGAVRVSRSPGTGTTPSGPIQCGWPGSWPTPSACCSPCSGRPASCRRSWNRRRPRCCWPSRRRAGRAAGKYLGVVLFVGLQAALFVGGDVGRPRAATGVWDGAYWLAVPLLIVNFAVFYAVSAFLAVWTRSTVGGVFGTLLFWLLCWAMNFTHHRLTAASRAGHDRGGRSS